MTLGRKTLLLQLLVSIGSILLSIVVLRATVFPSFVDIENDLVELNEKRVLAAITELDRFMLAMAGDYAGWTPTYEFVENPTEDYIEDNVSAPTLRNMNAHAVVVLDLDREIVAEYLLTEDSDEKLEFHDVVVEPEAVIGKRPISQHAPHTAKSSATVATTSSSGKKYRIHTTATSRQ